MELKIPDAMGKEYQEAEKRIARLEQDLEDWFRDRGRALTTDDLHWLLEKAKEWLALEYSRWQQSR